MPHVAGSGTMVAVISTPLTGRAVMAPPTRVKVIWGFVTVGVNWIDAIPNALLDCAPRRFVTVPLVEDTTVAPDANNCTEPPPAANPWLLL